VRGERPTEISRLEESISAAPESPHEVKPEESLVVTRKVTSPQRTNISKIRRIVVDPGHGGHDPGAVGSGGAQEKDIVLSIGLKLRQLLKEELGLDVVMTRSSDVFIPLEERTAIANKVNADLFVSVHANGANNRNASGIETYYLNLAKTEKAAQLAAKENGTSLEKVSVLQAILFDLMANYKLNDSAHLANDVQKSLHKKIRGLHADVKNLGVKQGPFYVLVGATMPSILVETAFLSNAQEELRLMEADYQEATAAGIMEGIRSYISSLNKKNPPLPPMKPDICLYFPFQRMRHLPGAFGNGMWKPSETSVSAKSWKPWTRSRKTPPWLMFTDFTPMRGS